MRIFWNVHKLLATLIFSGSVAVASAETISPVNPPRPVPEFRLKDQHEKEFSVQNLKGRWSLLFLGFTSCPDVCPMTLTRLEAVRGEMGLRLLPDQLPQVIFLAVDPARDRAILEKYMAHFHPDHIGISGEPAQIDLLVRGVGEFYRLGKQVTSSGHYDVVHSASVLVISPGAEVVAKIQPPLPVEETADYLNLLIRKSVAWSEIETAASASAAAQVARAR